MKIKIAIIKTIMRIINTTNIATNKAGGVKVSVLLDQVSDTFQVVVLAAVDQCCVP